MSSRTVALCALLIVSLGGTAASQVPDRSTAEAELVGRIDSLTRLVDQAAIEAEAAERARAAEMRRLAESRNALDTLRVGDLTVVAVREDAALAARLFQELWDEDVRRLGATSLGQWTFTFQRFEYDAVEIYPLEGTEAMDVTVPRWRTARSAKARVRNLLSRLIGTEANGNGRLGPWTKGGPLTRTDATSVYRAMTLSPSVLLRRCVSGALPACDLVLGLGGVPADDLVALYTPGERIEMARQELLAMVDEWVAPGLADRRVTLQSALSRFGPDFVEACVQRQVLEGCDELLTSPLLHLGTPQEVRSSLLAFALDRGGDGAWARLVEDGDAEPGAALAHAADVPLDQLVSDWRAWLVAEAATGYPDLPVQSVLTLGWFLLFATLATRSERCRLG